MKTILRDSRTGRFYAGDQGWVTDVSEAVEFDSISAAAALARAKRLETAAVVLRYEQPICELTVPLSECPSEAPDISLNKVDRCPPPLGGCD
jgi:hypothetical protein